MVVGELKGRIALLRLARWQLTAAFLMTAALSVALGGWRGLGQREVLLLAGSSLFGIMLASTTYYAAIYSAGPRVTALLFSVTSPFALGLGYLFLGETIRPVQGLGVACVLGGVVLALAPARTSGGPSFRPSRAGLALGVATALGQALGNLFARPAMAAGVEPFTAMAVRSGLAAAFFLLLAAFPFARDPAPFRVRDLGWAVTASLFGTVLGMSLLMAALATGQVGIVSTLSSMAPIAILPMVSVSYTHLRAHET